jgi:predicted ATPase
MKLTKLYIHNYKSFYDTTIELDKLNIVVGENNSGKSNLIDVLEFIDIVLTKNFAIAFEKKGGWEKIYNYNNDEAKMLIEFELSNNEYLKKTRLTFHEDYFIESTLNCRKIDGIILAFSVISSRVNFKKNKEDTRSYIFQNNMERINLLNEENKVTKLLNYHIYMEKSHLSTTYTFNTETIRNKSHRRAEKELQKNGSNLGQNLLYIKNNYPDSFNIISNSMIWVVNEIKGIDVQETFGNALIGFKERSQEIGIDMVSDGTINLLATITALNQDEDKSILLAFDEPERYLHMKAVHYLMDAFRSSKKQILITTHSTEILKYADLSEVIFIYRDSDGDTQSIRADEIPNLKEKMEHMTFERSMTLDEMLDEDMVWDFE